MHLLPRDLACAGFLSRLLVCLGLGRHVFVGEPKRIHDNVCQILRLACDHTIGDIVDVEKVCQEVGHNSQVLIIAIGVAVRGKRAGLETVDELSTLLGELGTPFIEPLARLLGNDKAARVKRRGPRTVREELG